MNSRTLLEGHDSSSRQAFHSLDDQLGKGRVLLAGTGTESILEEIRASNQQQQLSAKLAALRCLKAFGRAASLPTKSVQVCPKCYVAPVCQKVQFSR